MRWRFPCVLWLATSVACSESASDGSAPPDASASPDATFTCFPGDTLITLGDGTELPISEIRVGDEVLGVDEQLQPAVARVVRTFEHEISGDLVELNHRLTATQEHPIYASGQWIAASDIELGDELLYIEGDGSLHAGVTEIRAVPFEGAVYNLEVAAVHNYVANGVVVHNKTDSAGFIFDSGVTSPDAGALPPDSGLVDSSSPDADAMTGGCTSAEDCADPIREVCMPSSGVCRPAPQWAVTTIDYGPGTLLRTVDNCYFCDATLDANQALIRFQQGDGYTIWALYLDPSTAALGANVLMPAAAGEHWATLTESDQAVPSAYRGGYGTVSGTVDLTELDLQSGGRLAGSINVTFEKLGSSETANLSASFYAEFP